MQIVTGVTPDMRIMQEELFNPILPVVPCDSLDEAIRYVTARPRPLALYYYGADADEIKRLEQDVHAGGMTINDWAWHVFQGDLPFGGTGNSGIGSWRGPEGFRALSHGKSVLAHEALVPGPSVSPALRHAHSTADIENFSRALRSVLAEWVSASG